MTDPDSSRPALNGRSNSNGQGSASHSLKQGLRGWLRAMRRSRNSEQVREEIAELIEEDDGASAAIADEERVLLKNILALHDLTVEDVMVPRADIVAVEEGATLQEIVDLMGSTSHSRIPVYRATLDDVVGMVHIKDVLGCVGGERPFRLADIMRDVVVSVPSMRVLDLLLEMRTTRRHLAIVVDEYGGVDGLATIEDLVEEIVGEIEDEHDFEEGPLMTEGRDGTLTADARATVEDLEEKFGLFLSDEEREDIDTLGGLVFALAGRVPGRGELIRHPAGLEFEVVEADPRKVKRLRVRYDPKLGTAVS